MLFLNPHYLLRNAFHSNSRLDQAGSRFRFNKLAKACVLSGSAFWAVDAHAIYITYEFPDNKIPHIVDPALEGSLFSFNVSATSRTLHISHRPWTQKWDDVTSCVVSGEVVAGPSDSVTAVKNTFSMSISPRQVSGQVVIDSVKDEVTFKILDIPEQGKESIPLNAKGEVICDGEAILELSFGPEFGRADGGQYGWLSLGEYIDGQDPDTPPPTLQHKAIPTRQKSLTSQLNSLRTLTLHSSKSRDRGIAEELNRARSTTGFRADNLQVKANGQSVSVGSLMGAGAGDPLDDFGRWGMFVTGSIDAGKGNKNNAEDEGEFDSSQLTVGLDYHVNDHVVVGGAVNLTAMRAGRRSFAKTDFDRSSVSLFGSVYASDAFYLDVIVSYGMSNYDLSRSIDGGDGNTDSAAADTDGDESSAFVGAGYNLNKQNVNLRLFTSLHYIDANVDGYRESVSGSSSAAQIDGVDLQSFTADFGAELSWNMNTNVGVFTPMLSVAHERQYADDSVYITGAFIGGPDEGGFYHQGPNRDEEYMRAQAGVSGVFKNGFSAFITYESYLERDDFSSGQVSLGARWQF